MSGHTPGPWTVADELVKSLVVIDGATRAPVAMVVALDRSTAPDMEGRANARLIAAAPDLLAAAERVMSTPQHWVGEVNAAYDALRAAIEKARNK